MLSVRVPPAELNILAFPPVLRVWVIKGLGMSSLVYATGHIKDPVPLIEKRRGLSPGGRFPPSFIHQVIIITGLNKLYKRIHVLALKMASDAQARSHGGGGEGGLSPPPLEKFEPPLGCAVPFTVTIGIEVYLPPGILSAPPPANDTWLRRCRCRQGVKPPLPLPLFGSYSLHVFSMI